MSERDTIAEMLEGLRSADVNDRRYAAGWFNGEATWHGSLEVDSRDLDEIIEILVDEDDKEIRTDLAEGVAATVRYQKSYNLMPLYRYLTEMVQEAVESGEPLYEEEVGPIVEAFAYSSDDLKKDVWTLLDDLNDNLTRYIVDEMYDLEYNLER